MSQLSSISWEISSNPRKPFKKFKNYQNWGLKVKTFFNSPGNADFENDLIFNPSFNIRWEKAKRVKTMTRMLTSCMKLEIWCRHTSRIVHCFSFSSTNLWLKRMTFSKSTFLPTFFAFKFSDLFTFINFMRKISS